MKRRNFLSLAAATGLGLLLPPARRAQASTRYKGPYWITVHAAGGWDPTYLCDPKGGTAGKKDSINQRYTPDAIARAGEIAYAPVALMLDASAGPPLEFYSARRFFEAHAASLLVVNGIDTSTNNHETGTRSIWSGQPVEGYPSIGALAAAAVCGGTPAPMAYLSYGGYDVTAGVIPLTRASNADNLWRVAYPNRIDPKRPQNGTFLSEETEARIDHALAARTARLAQRDPLPVARRALQSLLAVRAGDAGLADIAAFLPEKLVSLDDFEDLKPAIPQKNKFNELEGFVRQAQLTLAAFQAGVGVAANLVIGGFDTHGDHDNQHIARLMQLLRGVDYLFTRAKALGLDDRLYVVMGSDFGRTPYYNQGNGKDHWSVTSMMLRGPGIAGNRVIGASDPGFRPLTFDPKTLAQSATGIRLQPAHLHTALRKLGGFDHGAVAERFPLPGDALPLFG